MDSWIVVTIVVTATFLLIAVVIGIWLSRNYLPRFSLFQKSNEEKEIEKFQQPKRKPKTYNESDRIPNSVFEFD